MGENAEKSPQHDVDTGPQGTRVFKRKDIEQYLADRAGTYDAFSGESSGAVLVGANGTLQDRRFDIPTGRSTVGRNPTNNIIIDDDSVSLVHARIFQKDHEWWVLNLLSTNGTYVNSRKVTDSILRDGDRVRFGEAEFIFRKPRRNSVSRSDWLRNIGRRLLSLFS